MNTQCAICQKPIHVPEPLVAHMEALLGQVLEVTCLKCEGQAARVKQNQFDGWIKQKQP